jgi:hypothetical protein
MGPFSGPESQSTRRSHLLPGPVCLVSAPLLPFSCSHGGHPDPCEAAVAGGGGYPSSYRGAPILAAARCRSCGGGAWWHESDRAHSERQAVRVRPSTWGTFGLLIWACSEDFRSSYLRGFVFEQAEGGGGSGWERVQALRLQEVQMLEAVRNLLFIRFCWPASRLRRFFYNGDLNAWSFI